MPPRSVGTAFSAPRSIFGLNVRISKTAAAPVIVDSSARQALHEPDQLGPFRAGCRRHEQEHRPSRRSRRLRCRAPGGRHPDRSGVMAGARREAPEAQVSRDGRKAAEALRGAAEAASPDRGDAPHEPPTVDGLRGRRLRLARQVGRLLLDALRALAAQRRPARQRAARRIAFTDLPGLAPVLSEHRLRRDPLDRRLVGLAVCPRPAVTECYENP